MSSKQKKFVCIFDSSHFVDTQQKLIKHMQKCKAMEKGSYECCKYNPLHWVKYDVIKEHEQKCEDQNKKSQAEEKSFTKILPDQISRYEFTLPFDLDMSMVQQTSSLSSSKTRNKQQSKAEQKKIDPNLMKKKEKRPLDKPKKIQMWKQPNFQDFLNKKGFKSSKKERVERRNEPQSFIANNDSFCI